MSTPTTGFQSTLERTATQFAQSVQAHEDKALGPLLQGWDQVRSGVQADLDALLERMAAAKAAGEPLSPSWLYREARYRSLIATAKAETARYATTVSPYVLTMQQDVATQAAAESAALVHAAVDFSAPGVSFAAVQPRNLASLAGFLAPGSPLQALISAMPTDTAAALRQALLQGIVRGKGPAWIAQRAGAALDLPRRRALTIARTEGMRVYRDVSKATYQKNADVLEGWEWHAALDFRICTGCLAMHGTVHALSETLDGHPNCRCAMVPRPASLAALLGEPSIPDSRPPIVTGEAWLKDQPASVQREVLGNAKYQAFKAGEIDVPDMVARTRDPDWGTMRRERSLLEITAGKHANRGPKPPEPKAVTTPASSPLGQFLAGKSKSPKPAPKITPAPTAAPKPLSIADIAAINQATRKAPAFNAAEYAAETAALKAKTEAFKAQTAALKGQGGGWAGFTPKAKATPGPAAAAQPAVAKQAALEVTQQAAVEVPAGVRAADTRRRFATKAEGRAWATRAWPGPEGFTSAQMNALRSYTGSGYRAINNSLRTSKGARGTGPIKTLDAAMDRAPRVPEDVIVSRGTSMAQFGLPSGGNLSEIIGQSFTEHGYLSTAVGPDLSAFKGEVAMRITVPKGSKGIYVSGKPPISSVGAGENELIMARGSRLVVTAVKRKGKRWEVEATLAQ